MGWRKELREMPNRKTSSFDVLSRGGDGRDLVPAPDDEFWREELAQMHARQSRCRMDEEEMPLRKASSLDLTSRGSNGRRPPPASDDNFWREELAEMKKRKAKSSMDEELSPRRNVSSFDPPGRGMRSRAVQPEGGGRSRTALAEESGGGGRELTRAADDDDEFWREELAQMKLRKSKSPMDEELIPLRHTGSVQRTGRTGEEPITRRRGRGDFIAHDDR